MTGLLMVFFGGGFGASLRWGVLRLSVSLGIEAAWAVLLVNLLGALVMGVLIGAGLARLELSEQLRLFLLTGLLSGFTTFSTLAADIVRLSERSWGMGMVYLVASIAGGVLLMLLGLRFGRGL